MGLPVPPPPPPRNRAELLEQIKMLEGNIAFNQGALGAAVVSFILLSFVMAYAAMVQ